LLAHGLLSFPILRTSVLRLELFFFALLIIAIGRLIV
jgi:hypothetical protein